MSRRFVLASLGAPAAMAAVFSARTALAQPAASSSPAATATAAAPVFANGMAQVVPAWRDSTAWIRHDLWVETDFDSDRDGRKDRVHVDVTRPATTEGGGLKVPVRARTLPAPRATIPTGTWSRSSATSRPRAERWRRRCTSPIVDAFRTRW
jgi:X-Pro dipeptidyl-peptidase